MTTAVFLDRDGTINEEVGYIRNVDDLRLISGAARSIRELNDADILTILTTNQSGPARGYYDETHVKALHARLEDLLDKEAGAWLDAIYYSPYLSGAPVEKYNKDADCRKPETGMIKQAFKDFPSIELGRSYVFGDKATDVDFAKNAGCKGILLRTGYGEDVIQGNYQELKTKPYLICRDINEAVKRVLAEQD